MYTKFQDFISTDNDPFANDKLGRASHITKLTQVISSIDNGCVMAINGEWGAGKTTFVKMWQSWLNQRGFSTAYYNAWETDYVLDPIIPIAGELYELFQLNSDREKANAFVTQLGYIIPKAVSKFINHKAAELIGEECVDELKNGTQILSNSMLSILDDYHSSKQSILDLRQCLTSLATNSDNPYIFFIDELDRCKPSYAVSVLERIKHLFNVPNIVFILSIDKVQLANSVRGYYGSDKIAAEEYLKRFIDFEYHLPCPNDTDDFITYLFSRFGLKSLLSFKNKEYGDHFTTLVSAFFKHLSLTPRQAEQLFSHFQFTIRIIQNNTKYDWNSSFILLYIRLFYPAVFQKIANREYSLQELVNVLEETFTVSFFEGSDKYDSTKYQTNFDIGVFIGTYFQTEWTFNTCFFWNSDEDKKNKKVKFTCSHINSNIISEAWTDPRFDGRYLCNFSKLIEAVEIGASLSS